MGTKIEAPKPRDYKQEMLDAMSAQESIQPRLLELERQYQPLYQKLQQDMMDRQMKYQLSSYESAIPEAARVSGLFSDAMAPVYSRMGEQAMSAYRTGLGSEVSGLYDTMLRSAQSDLSAGQSLTPEMQRQAQQSARAAMTARGLASGGQGVAAEVLNTYNMGIDRENRARQFAGSIYGTGQGNLQNAMSTYGNQMINQSAAYSPANLYGSAYGMSQGLGAQIFQPESQYNAQLVSANQQNQLQAQIANQQAKTGLTSGIMSMTGALGGGLLSNKNLFN